MKSHLSYAFLTWNFFFTYYVEYIQTQDYRIKWDIFLSIEGDCWNWVFKNILRIPYLVSWTSCFTSLNVGTVFWMYCKRFHHPCLILCFVILILFLPAYIIFNIYVTEKLYYTDIWECRIMIFKKIIIRLCNF